jgi:hypothetical protein
MKVSDMSFLSVQIWTAATICAKTPAGQTIAVCLTVLFLAMQLVAQKRERAA